jgi:feruloyl esterase
MQHFGARRHILARLGLAKLRRRYRMSNNKLAGPAIVSKLVALSVAALIAQAAQAAPGAPACEALTAPGTFPNTTVSSAKIVPADAAKSLPSYCEVTATVKPVAGSNIKVVYRLPDSWNGKLLGLGGGGWAGNVLVSSPIPGGIVAGPGLSKGYATAQTNGGHEVGMTRQGTPNTWDTSWSVNPEAVTDFSYRAIHVMTDVGKKVVAKYYGAPQKRAYFHGCSTGGRQALMEVQRYPQDYDGVIAGAPVYTLTTQTMSVVRNQILSAPGASLSTAQLKHLNEAALKACDGRDGLVDGVVTDPRACNFDPTPLQCAAGQKDGTCLSPAQVKAVHALYSATKTASGETVSYGLTRGSEAGWARFVSATAPPTREDFLTGAPGAGLGGLRPLVFGDANFDLPNFNPDRDYRTVRNSAFAAGYEAKNPDISPFVNRGGKLLLWHGMDDPGPSVLATIEYYEQMKAATTPKLSATAGSLDSNARFFVLPGVYHCRGGPGADDFDAVAALDQWVEQGQLPAMTASRAGEPAFTRPVCQYPTLPRYNGKGDPNLAASFHCK